MIRLSVTVETVDANLQGESYIEVAGTPFEGAYEYTPTNEAQVINISGKQAIADITINPIPSNYGLITWDGSNLTVS